MKYRNNGLGIIDPITLSAIIGAGSSLISNIFGESQAAKQERIAREQLAVQKELGLAEIEAQKEVGLRQIALEEKIYKAETERQEQEELEMTLNAIYSSSQNLVTFLEYAEKVGKRYLDQIAINYKLSDGFNTEIVGKYYTQIREAMLQGSKFAKQREGLLKNKKTLNNILNSYKTKEQGLDDPKKPTNYNVEGIKKEISILKNRLNQIQMAPIGGNKGNRGGLFGIQENSSDWFSSMREKNEAENRIDKQIKNLENQLTDAGREAKKVQELDETNKNISQLEASKKIIEGKLTGLENNFILFKPNKNSVKVLNESTLDYFLSGEYFLASILNEVNKNKYLAIGLLISVNGLLSKTNIPKFSTDRFLEKALLNKALYRKLFEGIKKSQSVYLNYSTDTPTPFLDTQYQEEYLLLMLNPATSFLEIQNYFKGLKESEEISKQERIIMQVSKGLKVCFDKQREHLGGLLLNYISSPENIKFSSTNQPVAITNIAQKINQQFVEYFNLELEQRLYRIKGRTKEENLDFVEDFNKNIMPIDDLFSYTEQQKGKFMAFLRTEQTRYIRTELELNNAMTLLYSNNLSPSNLKIDSVILSLEIPVLRTLTNKYRLTDETYFELLSKYEQRYLDSEASKIIGLFEQNLSTPKIGILTPEQEAQILLIVKNFKAGHYPKDSFKNPTFKFDRNGEILIAINSENIYNSIELTVEEYLRLGAILGTDSKEVASIEDLEVNTPKEKIKIDSSLVPEVNTETKPINVLKTTAIALVVGFISKKIF